jgi:hypothetical protein
MYRINKKENHIREVKQKKFSDLGFSERNHLQEWIAKNPKVLGEDLLIIQKEYQGFNDTRERLDLLALDKSGNIVVIENKLDDSGRDVVWQGLKYVSYCSTLTNEQILRIFQEFIDSKGLDSLAEDLINEFLENDGDLDLNSGDQRLILIANNFRKEVTSTVMWLLNHDIQIQCFKIIPYQVEEEYFLQIDQIIPLPEMKEYIIDANKRQKEKKELNKSRSKTYETLVEFWGALKSKLKEEKFDIIDHIKVKKTWYIGRWYGRAFYAFCIGKKAIRIELYMDNDHDRLLITTLEKYKSEIEKDFGNQLVWQIKENTKATRVYVEASYREFYESPGGFSKKEYWPEMMDWYVKNMKLFYSATKPYWDKVENELK